MERGVVFTAREILQTENGDGFQTGKQITVEELNYLVLYWDRLVSPTNNIIHFSLINEEELIQCGILSRPRFVQNGFIDGQVMTEFHAKTHALTLNALRQSEGMVDWRMHFLNEQVSIHQEVSEQRAVLRFELADLLPVPQKDTPLHEILEFKERRSDELMALHGYLDELYTEVLRSGDFNLERAKAISGLKKSLHDLNELNNQGWRSPLKFNLSSSFEFDFNQIYSGVATAYAAMKSPHPIEVLCVGGLFTLFGGFIKVRPQIQSVLKNGDTKLAYITRANKEGIIFKS
ncbi:DUF6236 family protein [Citrobacter sp. U14242]|uniref:DUF6236 family protein n=1 Tax=Citrobacter sp. U14242 TaxID=3390192 RepID=UPI00397A2A29